MRAFLVFMACVLVFSGCASNKPSVSPVALPAPPQARSLTQDANAAANMPGVSFSADQRIAAQEVYAVQRSSPSSLVSNLAGVVTGSSTSSSGTTAQLPSSTDNTSGEMIDIQARFAVQCDVVADAAAKFRALVQASGGRTTTDEANAGKETEVTFEVRIPAERFEAFVSGVDGLGAVQAREIKKRDVGKEFHDSELLLHEREVALGRYEELLKQTKTVPETIEVERQLERLRADIDRIKGDLVWLKDRVASATVVVRFFPSPTSEDAVFAPTATLYPAVRASMLFDLRSETQRYGYLGGGVSIQFKPFGRALTFDFDLARTAMTDRPTGSDYAYLFLTGFDLYSDLLGGGRRKFLNPYLGFRVGFGITNGLGDFAFGGVVGVDLIKTKAVLLDVHAKVLGLVGNDQGPHIMLGPELGFGFAF